MRGFRLVPVGTKYGFIRQRRITFVLSALLSLFSIIGLFWPGLNFGIDFRGGVLIEARSTQGPANLGQLRSMVSGLNIGEVALQDFGGDRDVLIRVESQGDDRANLRAVARVREVLGEAYEVRRTEVVGPKVGGELIRAGFIAAILALVGIAIYVWFRFEWQFGMAALVSTFHDVVTTLGIFALFDIEFNLASVAAVLTIAGYSINDTVVVFDRIRETMRRYKSMQLADLINMAINDTLSRTTLTSATTFIAVLSLFVVGGEVIRSFTAAILWGILVGTYSSIFLAAPLLLYLRPIRSTAQRAAETEVETGAAQARP